MTWKTNSFLWKKPTIISVQEIKKRGWVNLFPNNMASLMLNLKPPNGTVLVRWTSFRLVLSWGDPFAVAGKAECEVPVHASVNRSLALVLSLPKNSHSPPTHHVHHPAGGLLHPEVSPLGFGHQMRFGHVASQIRRKDNMSILVHIVVVFLRVLDLIGRHIGKDSGTQWSGSNRLLFWCVFPTKSDGKFEFFVRFVYE